jgi:hypothetical protein
MSRINLILILFTALLFSVTEAFGQEYPVPGQFGDFNEYYEAKQKVFSSAYARNVQFKTSIKTKYGRENYIGLKSDSTGYRLFHLYPEHSIWYSSYKDVPCNDQKADYPDTATCIKQDFSAVDSIQVHKHEIDVDSTLAYSLISLWHEMLMSSRYHRSNVISTGGITYQYSSFIPMRGKTYAYSRNPDPITFAGRFAEVNDLIRKLFHTDTATKSDTYSDQLRQNTHELLADLYQHGDKNLTRGRPEPWLSACSSELIQSFAHDYCWQTKLSYNEYPDFIIAVINGDNYNFILVHFTSEEEFKQTKFYPVYAMQERDPNNTFLIRNFYYPMNPWEISDLRTSTHHGQIRIFGYYDGDKLFINFTGFADRKDPRKRMDIGRDSRWMSADDIF